MNLYQENNRKFLAGELEHTAELLSKMASQFESDDRQRYKFYNDRASLMRVLAKDLLEDQELDLDYVTMMHEQIKPLVR